MSSPRDDPSSGDADEDGGERADKGPRTSPTARPDDSSPRSDGSPPRSDGGERTDEPTGPLAPIHRFRRSENGAVVFVREMLSSAAIVLAIGLLLFAISGVWPPMVAIESGSMEPQMQKGDLVFIMDEDRLVPDAAQGDTGVVTYQAGAEAGYKQFDDYGDVIIYEPDGKDYAVPIIHRARFWVDEGENWYDRADQEHIPNGVDNCQELSNCPAPNSGFITKGDANRYYDQSGGMGISGPVQSEWVRGTAEVRVPYLGWIRLYFSGAA